MSTQQAKPKRKSKTWWGILATVLGALLAAFGIAADPSFLADGFQVATDLMPAFGLVTAVVGWALKSYGQRTATQPLQVLLILLLPLALAPLVVAQDDPAVDAVLSFTQHWSPDTTQLHYTSTTSGATALFYRAPSGTTPMWRIEADSAVYYDGILGRYQLTPEADAYLRDRSRADFENLKSYIIDLPAALQ